MSDNINNDITGLDKETSQEVMTLVLDHYIKYHGVVLKKLQIAQEATAQSIGEVASIVQPAQGAEKYDEMWGSIIGVFESHGVSEEDMKRIEDVLLIVPKQIKAHYDRIMEQDAELVALIEKLNSDEYQKAYEIVKDVQIKENPLSHLGPEEYDDVPEEDVFAYKMMPGS